MGAVVLAALLVSSHFRSTPYSNLSLLAASLVHGHVWVDGPARLPADPVWNNLYDALLWNGHRYVIEGVVPALLLIPAAFLYGEQANQTYLAIGLCEVAVIGAYWLFRRVGAGLSDALLLTGVFFAGTSLWWCAMLGDVWFIEHVSAVCSTILALLELTGKRRGWVVALCAGCAFESRFTMALAVPFYVLFLARGGIRPETTEPEVGQLIASLRSFALALVPFAVGYVVWNELRWGTWNDVGYTEFYHADSWGQPTGSPFRLAYVPYELYSFFMQPPTFWDYRQLAWTPYIKADPHGIALEYTTPALLLALRAKGSRWYLTLMWATIFTIWLPSLCYYLNGWVQYGMRHALDFEPFWFVLLAVAARRGLPWWGRLLCWYSIAFGIWGVWYWDSFVRQGS